MNKIVITVVAMIAIIALSLTGVILFGLYLLNDENENPAVLEVGEFVEYNNTQRNLVNGTWITHWMGTERDVIIAMNDTHYSMNVTIFPAEYPGWNYSSPYSWPKDWTFGAYTNVTNSESDYNLVRVGRESVDTKWGSLNCDHYIGSPISNESISYDVFTKNGILVEWATTFLVNENVEMYVFLLTDTNILEITG